MKRVVLLLLRFYQLSVSPFKPPSCRFYPTCSHYAVEAVEVHGAWRGILLACKRLIKCGPWHRGGYDPVPRPLTYTDEVRIKEGTTSCSEE
jgi:putative membrane protein insertion efficiency factor